MTRTLLATLALSAALAFPAAAQQQTSSSIIFDNWIKNCTSQTDKDNKTSKACEARSTLLIRDQQTNQQGVAAVVAIGRVASGPDKSWQAIVQVPIAALLSTPAALTKDDGKVLIQLPYTACQPQVCTAAVKLDDSQIASLKNAGAMLHLTYRNQAGQDIKLDASTTGLTAALDAIAKEK